MYQLKLSCDSCQSYPYKNNSNYIKSSQIVFYFQVVVCNANDDESECAVGCQASDDAPNDTTNDAADDATNDEPQDAPDPKEEIATKESENNSN